MSDRNPYVGEGADGARRSAEIDRSEADTYDPGPDRDRCLASAARWDEQADRLEQAEKQLATPDPMRGEHVDGCKIGGTHAAPCRDINAVPLVPIEDYDDPPLTPEQERDADEYEKERFGEPELETLNAHTRYEWDCDDCGTVHTLEHDPAGEVVTCDDCGAKFRIGETR